MKFISLIIAIYAPSDSVSCFLIQKEQTKLKSTTNLDGHYLDQLVIAIIGKEQRD